MTNHFESIRAFRLYEKTSKHGNTYLVGRWGGAKVAILKSRDVADDGNAVWDVLLSPAPERPKNEKQIEQLPKITASTSSSNLFPVSPELDDEIPF